MGREGRGRKGQREGEGRERGWRGKRKGKEKILTVMKNSYFRP